MTTGLVALTNWQATIEATYGTGGTATRIVPMTATPKHNLEVFEGQQDRGTLISHYDGDTIATKEHVEISGATAIATFEDVPWFLQAFVKGGVTGSTSGHTGAYEYTFTPTATSDDLKSMCFEFGTDTQGYKIVGVLGKKLEIAYDRNSPVMLNMDFIGQRMTSTTVTNGLSQRSLEALTTGATTAYIDTSTYGSTNPGNVLDAKITLENGTEFIHELGGNTYPGTYARARRTLAYEATLQFSSATEYAAYLAGTARKLRLKTTGTSINGSNPSTAKLFQVDLYVQRWKVADFGRQGNIWTVKVSGSSAYEASLSADFKMTCINDVSTLP